MLQKIKLFFFNMRYWFQPKGIKIRKTSGNHYEVDLRSELGLVNLENKKK